MRADQMTQIRQPSPNYRIGCIALRGAENPKFGGLDALDGAPPLLERVWKPKTAKIYTRQHI
jgi:hypothetical protein